MGTQDDNPWLQPLTGVEFHDADTGDEIGRSDVVNLGAGLEATWDATAKELTINANAGFTTAETSADVTVTAGAGATTIFDYDLSTIETEGVAIVDGQSVLVDVRVEAWRNADEDVAGYCDATAHLVYHAAGSLKLNDPDVEQTISSSFEAGLTVTFSIVSNTKLRVTATSSTTTVRCSVLVSHRPPRTRTTV